MGCLHGLARRLLAACLVATFLATQSPLIGASADKTLQRLSGTVGHSNAANGPFAEIVASLVLPGNEFAITRDRSQALLMLPNFATSTNNYLFQRVSVKAQ